MNPTRNGQTPDHEIKTLLTTYVGSPRISVSTRFDYDQLIPLSDFLEKAIGEKP